MSSPEFSLTQQDVDDALAYAEAVARANGAVERRVEEDGPLHLVPIRNEGSKEEQIEAMWRGYEEERQEPTLEEIEEAKELGARVLASYKKMDDDDLLRRFKVTPEKIATYLQTRPGKYYLYSRLTRLFNPYGLELKEDSLRASLSILLGRNQVASKLDGSGLVLHEKRTNVGRGAPKVVVVLPAGKEPTWPDSVGKDPVPSSKKANNSSRSLNPNSRFMKRFGPQRALVAEQNADELEDQLRAGIVAMDSRLDLKPAQKAVLEALKSGKTVEQVAAAINVSEAQVAGLVAEGYKRVVAQLKQPEPPKASKTRGPSKL